LDLIFLIPYLVDTCALPSVLPSLSLTDDLLYVYGLGRRRRLLDIWILLLHIVVKRVRNSTPRFRSAFYSTDGPAYDSAPTSSHLYYENFPYILRYSCCLS